ncbi:Ig-like domain repeat protein, partial [Methanobrevibacter sp.]
TKISPELSVVKTTVDGRTVLNATVPADARGNINFEVNGSTYKAQITKGCAVVTLPDMAPGTYKLTTTYKGNYKYLPETKTRTITIK